MLTTKTVWVFDLDGTLTQPQHDFDAMRRELGLLMGVPILEALDELPKHEAEPLHQRLEAWERDLARRAQPQPGALELVRAIHEQQARLGVLTRNTAELALLTLEAIGMLDYFAPEHVLGRFDAAPKPSPEGLHKLLSAFGAAGEEAVMVGDFRFDIEAGRAAGMTTVLLTDGAESFGADHVIRALDELVWR